MKRIEALLAVLLSYLLVASILFPGYVRGALRDDATGGVQEYPDPNPVRTFVQGRVLVRFRQDILTAGHGDLVSEAGARDKGELEGTGVHVLELPANANEEAVVKALQSRPEVEFAELDSVYAPDSVVPNDPLFPNEWHLQKISAPTAWSATTGSNIITVAILDTGVDSSHPDLAAKVVPGWNFYDNNADTSDVYGHGTAVAGSAAASSNNGTGVSSVAWGCQIMPVRISRPDGYADTSTIASGLIWAADHGARVANISYAATGSSTVSSAASYFQTRGGVVTVSAGNSSIFDASPDNPYVLTVSATGSNDALASWSNTGNNIDVAAPGVGIYTTNRGGGYGSWSGTSFSAPVVAGVAALVLSANPYLSAAEVQGVLKQSADDLGPSGWDASYGWGRVNAARAVSLALGGAPPPADTTPPAVSIISPSDGTAVSGAVSVQISASDDTGVASVSLSLDGALLGTDTTNPYGFSWSSLAATNGTHILTATARDGAGNTATTSINVTVNNAADTTPPSIIITSPANGSRVSGIVSVLVNAVDDVGVVRVELYIDGNLQATSASVPFTTRWNARRAAAGAHSLMCKAYDAAGNAGASSTETVFR